MPKHFLLPEEEEISYFDYIGAALKTAFPKTALAYDLLENPIKEGVSAATDPYGPIPQIFIDQELVNRAAEDIPYFEDKLSKLEDKLSASRQKGEKDSPSHLQRQDHYQKALNEAEALLSYRKQQRATTAKDKVSRFIRGALGEDLDYVDTKVEENYPLGFIMEGDIPPYDEIVDFKATARSLKGRDKLEKMYKRRTDIFRLGQQLPQRYGSMVPSEHKPTEEELEQITTEGAQAFVGQGGWKSDRPIWDFKDKDFDPSSVLGSYGKFQSQDMRSDDSEPPEGGDYEAFSDVWDFKILDRIRMGGITLGQALDELEFYQAPQLYGRRYGEDQE